MHDAYPRPLSEGERVELWLVSVASSGEATGSPDAADSEVESDGWDIRLARVVATRAGEVAVAAGGWGLTGAANTTGAVGAPAVIRRSEASGIAEWEGTISWLGGSPPSGAVAVAAGAAAAAPLPEEVPAAGAQETVVGLRLSGEQARGRLYQRRRSPRLTVRLSPVRLTPLPPNPNAQPSRPATPVPVQPDPADELPVARLSDVSTHGAGIVIDTPLEEGTPVALEFELPGEQDPFTIRGRVVAPANEPHDTIQPQPDGLPGFRRGIEFLGTAAGRESQRLAEALNSLLHRRTRRE